MLNKLNNERGFATLEVILMITVLGILSAIAVPRFTSVITSANTAKVQADLSTIDNAIALYQMENDSDPIELSQLSKYIQDVTELKPPTGSMYVKGDEKKITGPGYVINDNRAKLDGYTAGEITKNKST